MIFLKNENFERVLPDGYKEALHLNAKNFKVGLILNVISVAVWFSVMALSVLPIAITNRMTEPPSMLKIYLYFVIFLMLVLIYMVLHEIVHGIAYKSLTGEKLSFGLSWSCAFCGLPNTYVYRKTALIAAASPFVLFSVVFIALTVVFYFINPMLYFLFASIFGMHLGGCSGDIYYILLFLFKFKDKRVLSRDTGPEQFIYIPSEDH